MATPWSKERTGVGFVRGGMLSFQGSAPARMPSFCGLKLARLLWFCGMAIAVCPLCACSGAPAEVPPQDCHADPSLFDFSGQTAAKSGQGTFELRMLSLSPQAPTKGDNSWTFELLDAEHAPLIDPVIQVTPFMPQHGHGTGVKAVVMSGTAPGTWVASPVNLWMPGLWEVKVTVSKNGQADNLVIRACIEG